MEDSMRFMKHKTATENLSYAMINGFLYKIRRSLAGILFAAFIFTTFHPALHNSFDKNHNSDCPVYVLEQLYFGADIVGIVSIITLFLPFLLLSFQTQTYRFQARSYFSIRAPPLF